MSTNAQGAIDRLLARRALEDYARRREADAGSTAIVDDLPALVDRARAAGLDLETIGKLAEGRTQDGG